MTKEGEYKEKVTKVDGQPGGCGPALVIWLAIGVTLVYWLGNHGL